MSAWLLMLSGRSSEPCGFFFPVFLWERTHETRHRRCFEQLKELTATPSSEMNIRHQRNSLCSEVHKAKASPEPEALVPRLGPCRDCPKSSATTPLSGSLLLRDDEWALLPLDRKDQGSDDPTYTPLMQCAYLCLCLCCMVSIFSISNHKTTNPATTLEIIGKPCSLTEP